MNNIKLLKDHFPRICIINLYRDPYFVCNSALNARLKRYNDVRAFHHHLPRNIQELRQVKDPVEQIVLQVKSILLEIQDDITNFSHNDIFNVTYENIKAQPLLVIKKFSEFLTNHNIDVKRKSGLPVDPMPNRDTTSLIPVEYRDQLDRHFERQFPGKSRPQ